MIRPLRAAAVVAVAIAIASTAHADNKDKARDLYREATHHYDFGEYQLALDGFKAAYENYEDPAFLFNIAQCHRALGHKQDAITFYRSYLRNSPGAPNRDDVQKLVADLQAAVDREKAAAPPSQVTPPPRPAPLVQSATPAAPATSVTAHADAAPHGRKWVWGVVAAAVVVVGVGVGLGVGLGMQPHPPGASYGTVSF